MTEVFQNRKVGNQIPEGNSCARFASLRLEDTERKILDGKMRIRRNFDERF